ncbi:MAG TPA: type IV pilin, partial [Methanocorpusculum sp.]|nr:type IV pilin [Methanocorpusculum sp.]
GVMLMLVVTIVIAAVVAAFAGGIATDTEPTPSVVLSADAYEDKVMIQSLSGDRLEIDKLSVNIYKEDGEFIVKGTIDKTGQDSYFTPGEILKVTLGEKKLSDTVQIVVTSNDKHTVFNKEVIVKA